MKLPMKNANPVSLALFVGPNALPALIKINDKIPI